MAHSPRASASQPCKLFIGGLSYDTTDASLHKYFSKFGQVASAVVLRDPATTRSRGFGFVTFCTLKAANAAISCKQHSVDGRKVEAKFAVPRSSAPLKNTSTSNNLNTSSSTSNSGYAADNGSTNNNNADQDYRQVGQNGRTSSFGGSGDIGSPVSSSTKSKGRNSPTSPTKRSSSLSVVSQSSDANGIIQNKIFVGGLLYATGHDSMRKYFEQFGPVENAEVIYNRDTKKSRGFGFVVFQHAESVQKVIDAQHDRILVIDNKQVEVKQCVARQESGNSTNGTGSQSASTVTTSSTTTVPAKPSSSISTNGVNNTSQSSQPVQNKWKENTLTFDKNLSGGGTNNLTPRTNLTSPQRSVSVASAHSSQDTGSSSMREQAGSALNSMTHRPSTSSNDSNGSGISLLNNNSETLAPPTISADPVLPSSSRQNRNHIPEPIGSPLHGGSNRRRFFTQNEPAVGLHRASSAPHMNADGSEASNDWDLGGLKSSLPGLQHLESPASRAMSGSFSIEGFGGNRMASLDHNHQHNQSMGDLRAGEHHLNDLGVKPRHPRTESVTSIVSAGGLFEYDFGGQNQQLPLPPLSLGSPTGAVGKSGSSFFGSSSHGVGQTSNGSESPFRQAMNNQVSRNQYHEQQFRPSPLHTAASFTLGSRTPERHMPQQRTRHGSFVGSNYNPLDFSPRASSHSLSGSPGYWEPQPLQQSNLSREQHQRSLTSSFSSEGGDFFSSREMAPSALLSANSGANQQAQHAGKGSHTSGAQSAFRSNSLNNENANAGWSNFSSGFGTGFGGIGANSRDAENVNRQESQDPRVEADRSHDTDPESSSITRQDQRVLPLYTGF